jgi:hypothetical protein
VSDSELTFKKMAAVLRDMAGGWARESDEYKVGHAAARLCEREPLVQFLCGFAAGSSSNLDDDERRKELIRLVKVVMELGL